MERREIIIRLKSYFDIRELVSPDVYAYRGELAWGEFDTRLLETTLALRVDILKVPMIVNDWKRGGVHTQRGFRENTCELVAKKTKAGIIYLTPHDGLAIDFTSPKMTPDGIRKTIVANAKKLPYPIRLEDGKSAPSWVHVDVRVDDFCKDKITWFG